MKIILTSGTEIELSGKDGYRLQRMVARNTRNFRRLDSGVMINMDVIGMIIPDKDVAPEVVVEAPPEIKEPEAPPEEPKNKLHIGQLKAIMDSVKMDKEAFAKSLGYSVTTIHMALKEGKISQPLSDAIVAKYLSDDK